MLEINLLIEKVAKMRPLTHSEVNTFLASMVSQDNADLAVIKRLQFERPKSDKNHPIFTEPTIYSADEED